MRVLFLLHNFRGNIKRIHYDLIEEFMKICDVKMYGSSEKSINNKLISPIEFKSELQLKDVVSEIKPDVLVLPSKALCGRFFDKCGIENVKNIPKIVSEDDFYEIEDVEWYEKVGIDLLMMLHPYDPKTLPISSVWIPPGVSGEQFLVDSINNDRIDRVVFVGSGRYSQNKYYKIRQDAIRKLEVSGVLDCHGNVGYDNYPKLLKKYKVALSCSFPPLDFPPIKAFEIIASGTVLMITPFKYQDILFGDDKCFYIYKSDCSDIIDVANEILNSEESIEVAKTALQVVKNNHLFEHRAKEMFDIFSAILSGKEIPRKWKI